MKSHTSQFFFTGAQTYLSKLILVAALALYASANAFAEENQNQKASAIKVAMVTAKDKDVKKNRDEKRKDYFNEKSSTYVSNLLCE